MWTLQKNLIYFGPSDLEKRGKFQLSLLIAAALIEQYTLTGLQVPYTGHRTYVQLLCMYTPCRFKCSFYK